MCRATLSYTNPIQTPVPLSQVIGELDEKKRWALEDTWTKVNAWFGSIFSSLLPGTQAKLEPPEGATWESGTPPRSAKTVDT